MNRLLVGIALGALGTWAALKLVDDEKRAALCERFGDASDRARARFDEGLTYGRGRALRAGVVARREVRDSKKKIGQTAGDIAGKLAANLSEFEAKAKGNS